MQYLNNLARKWENPGHILLSRINNLGVYKVNDQYEIWDVIQNCRWDSYGDIEETYDALEKIYKSNPLLLLCEPDGTLWHDTGIITDTAKFMAKALETWTRVEIMAVP